MFSLERNLGATYHQNKSILWRLHLSARYGERPVSRPLADMLAGRDVDALPELGSIILRRLGTEFNNHRSVRHLLRDVEAATGKLARAGGVVESRRRRQVRGRVYIRNRSRNAAAAKALSQAA